jgi:hypothetical protein
MAALGIDSVASRFQHAERPLTTCQQRDCRISKKPSSDLRWEHLFKDSFKGRKEVVR